MRAHDGLGLKFWKNVRKKKNFNQNFVDNLFGRKNSTTKFKTKTFGLNL
jgi:hypothetical protein